MKTLSILLALINSLAAALIIAASLPAIQILHPAASLSHAARVVLCAGVVAAGVLTWIAACRATSQALLFVTGLFLVALGTAAAVWTLHAALSTGNIKDHMFLYGGSLMAQGAFTLWDLLSAVKTHAAL